jgi:hypothetical protein
MPIITGRTPSGNVVDVAVSETGIIVTTTSISGTVPISGDIEVVSANILEGYKLADMETGGANEYYGYTDKDENWYIMQLTTTTSKYCSGVGAYAAAWALRVPPGQTYLYYHEVF